MLPAYAFSLKLDVRDYECDMQGIVNNAVYLNYLEHTRHVYLKQLGGDFAEITRRGVHLVVVRTEIDYLASLRSGDSFVVGLNLERVSRLRFAFLQDIFRLPDHKPMVRARVIATSITAEGKPCLPAEIEQILERVRKPA